MQACHVLPRENLRRDWLGTSGTEMLKAEQSGPITERLWNGAGQMNLRTVKCSNNLQLKLVLFLSLTFKT